MVRAVHITVFQSLDTDFCGSVSFVAQIHRQNHNKQQQSNFVGAAEELKAFMDEAGIDSRRPENFILEVHFSLSTTLWGLKERLI